MPTSSAIFLSVALLVGSLGIPITVYLGRIAEALEKLAALSKAPQESEERK